MYAHVKGKVAAPPVGRPLRRDDQALGVICLTAAGAAGTLKKTVLP